MVQLDLRDFLSDKTRIKYSCAREAVAISKDFPEGHYHDLDFFIQLLKSENNIFKGTATKSVGNPSKVDNKKKIDKVIPSPIDLL
jgi:hypothetical protein